MSLNANENDRQCPADRVLLWGHQKTKALDPFDGQESSAENVVWPYFSAPGVNRSLGCPHRSSGNEDQGGRTRLESHEMVCRCETVERRGGVIKISFACFPQSNAEFVAFIVPVQPERTLRQASIVDEAEREVATSHRHLKDSRCGSGAHKFR